MVLFWLVAGLTLTTLVMAMLWLVQIHGLDRRIEAERVLAGGGREEYASLHLCGGIGSVGMLVVAGVFGLGLGLQLLYEVVG